MKVGLAQRYDDILSAAEPYLLSFPENFQHFDLNPWGLEIREENCLSCLRTKNSLFYELLHKLDGLSFGPKGMPMAKWVFFDCGEMPGGVFGFGLPARDLPDETRIAFGLHQGPLSEYRGLVPISMYIAIPMASGKNSWFGHNLSSANQVMHHKYPGLGLLTKAVAAKTLKIETLIGATQWNSDSLSIHLQLDDMEMLSAFTPAHTFPNTMTYRSHYTDEKLVAGLGPIKREATHYDFLYPEDDHKFSMGIQERIENGESFRICGRPINKDQRTFLPVRAGAE